MLLYMNYYKHNAQNEKYWIRPSILIIVPIPVVARFKAWVYGRSPAGNVGSNPAGGMDVCLLWVLCVVR
jgi:hypothetical protein